MQFVTIAPGATDAQTKVVAVDESEAVARRELLGRFRRGVHKRGLYLTAEQCGSGKPIAHATRDGSLSVTAEGPIRKKDLCLCKTHAPFDLEFKVTP